GFSVVTPLAVGFPVKVDPRLEGERPTERVRLFVAQPGHSLGQSMPLRLSVVSDATSDESMLIAYPLRPLAYDTDYVAVVLDSVVAADGSALSPSPAVQVALGLVPPKSDQERALFAYHAPTRTLLKAVGV